MVRIQRSALVVWIGPGMEPWLVQTAGRLPPTQQLALLPHSVNEHDEHGEEEDHQPLIENDPHIWLDPQAVREQVAPLAARLKQLYPAKVDEIDSRAAQFSAALSALDREIGAQLKPVQAQGFVVYHDGYQRLVQRYHLNQRAAVWHHESIPTGARERSGLLTLLNSGDVKCLFYEPEHGLDAVNGWLGGAAMKVKMVELDPLGQSVAVDSESYPRFLRGLVGQMVGCLQ
jgi:zinc transport system substrate-binding protein